MGSDRRHCKQLLELVQWIKSKSTGGNAIKIAVADQVLRYGMDKSPAGEWNMVVGAQYQLNKKWMLRTEGGIIGDRKSFLLSLNYRFLL